MEPKKYLYQLAQAVSKRSGISINTCQVVLPALFDELRYMLCEGRYRVVTIESFGTLAVRELPQRHYTRRYSNGITQVVDLPPKLVVKFTPTRNLRNEVQASRFDPTRQSFSVHPDDHPIRTRKRIDSKPRKKKVQMNMEGNVVNDVQRSNSNRESTILRGREAEDEQTP